MLLVNTKLSVEQRLQKAVSDIMMNPKYIALAGLLTLGERGVKDDVPTACTNGKDEWYGRDFVESLSDPELRFLVLHEVYHKLYRHLITWQHLYKQNAMLANKACDYVINIKLVDDNKDGFATMTGELANGCFNEKYRGWDSAQVYNDLSSGDDEEGGGQGGQQPFDQHDWEGAEELTPEQKRELAKDIDEAIRQGALIAGKLGSDGDRDLAELLQPQVDWREVLRDFITETCAGSDYATYRRPNRRYIGMDIIMPSGVSEKVEELITAPDQSGSIGQREQSVIFTEIASICDTVKPSRLRNLYWDTEVCREEK